MGLLSMPTTAQNRAASVHLGRGIPLLLAGGREVVRSKRQGTRPKSQRVGRGIQRGERTRTDRPPVATRIHLVETVWCARVLEHDTVTPQPHGICIFKKGRIGGGGW